ncbi:class I SAM-dependent DNA methyltransferase [Nostoc sp. 'Lobaria pulmonaria (5183) cyanobiont']|uniref:class I SAM-dependent DNA methyltransferase n=1 Tax=Nostoc sp. 'Lobaria pulmonaria (5183) cyanobiont' TaxID=1618022 RepID=UPI000D0C0E56|nr:class I SAM-dependent methyltransferase [Nostoc sp. 'Lobaria pulmonaria (5183) cyanobiont']AVH69222.1 type 11 methyltransferase [Nostoc sp. 'Lobaria pulmonaria (5183) cyanobiont']
MNKTDISPESRYTDYDPWAWLYNKSEAELACKGLLPNIEKLLLPHLSKGAKIFDLCCGTGQLSQELIAKGYEIVGLDGSEKMLHYARQNAPDAEFILGDARDFKLPYTFEATICTDSALNHIMSLEELKSVFSNVYKVLKENGLFLFDIGLEKRYANIFVNDGEMQENYAWTVGETYNPEEKVGTFTITMFQQNDNKLDKKPNSISLLIKNLKRIVYNKFLRRTKPSALLQLVEKDWQPSEINFSVKPYSKTEIQSVLEEVGFTSLSIYNSNGELADPENNKYAYFVGRKPSASLSLSKSD